MQRRIAIAQARINKRANKAEVNRSVVAVIPTPVENIRDDIITNEMIERAPTQDDDAEITPEQKMEINALLDMLDKTLKQEIGVTSTRSIAPGIAGAKLGIPFILAKMSAGQSIQENVFLKNAAINTSVIFLTILKVAVDYLTLKTRKKAIFNLLPGLNDTDKLTIKEANKIIQELKIFNAASKQDSDFSSKLIRVVAAAFLGLCISLFLIDTDGYYLIGYALFAATAILPSVINDTRSLVLNYNFKENLINKKKILDEMIKNVDEAKCTLYLNGSVGSSFFLFNFKNIFQNKVTRRLAFSAIEDILKKYSIKVEPSLKYFTFAVHASVNIKNEIAAKINKEIIAQITELNEIELLKDQLLEIGKKWNLFFTFTHQRTSNGLSFYVQTASEVSSVVEKKLKHIFGDDCLVINGLVKINTTKPLSQDVFDSFVASMVAPKAKSSDVVFFNESTSSANVYRHFNKEESDSDSAEKTKTKKPTVIAPNIQYPDNIEWATGEKFDFTKAANDQNVKMFCSDNLPAMKIFAKLSLTKEDFSSSSISYLFDRFKAQADNPTKAAPKGDEGFIFNLFGVVRDPQGNKFTYDGKLKIKGKHGVGDARAYFVSKIDPKSGAVLCDIKAWKPKTHKKH